MFKPSKYQRDIFDCYRNTNKNIVVEAVPGSGKTTTILKLLDFVPPSKSVLYAAFNKSIVLDIKEKIGKLRGKRNINVSTLHGLGMSTIKKNQLSKIEVTPFKNIILFQKLNNEKWHIPEKKVMIHAFITDQLINHFKLSLSKNYSDILKLAIKYDIDFIDDDIQRTVELLEYLESYDRVDKPSLKKMINFADMLYFPIKFDMEVKKYDEVFIDECQDLNKAQQELLKKAMKSGSRFVAVGDRKQAIYAFMGADEKAFDNFYLNPNTINLPLSVSYRCKSNIVDNANSIYNSMEVAEGNEGGEVRKGSYKEIEEGDFVLCRNNAPLVEMYLELLSKEKKCFIKGKDLGVELLALCRPIEHESEAKSYFVHVLSTLENNLRSKGVKNPKETKRYRHLIEKITILSTLLKSYQSLESLRNTLEEMFTDEKREGICLSTIHKAKGLEADNVFILSVHLIPSPYAESPNDKIQEENLRFVAYTRAKNKLIFINDFGMPAPKKIELEEDELISN